MSTENPYAGITLPEPPAGYRLAKWGEEYDERALWCNTWGHLGQPEKGKWVSHGEGRFQLNYWVRQSAWNCVYAIPLDQPSPLKSWQFREVPWVVPEPKTLADVPDDVDVICCLGEDKMCSVVYRRANYVFYRHGNGSSSFSSNHPIAWKFVRYLDPPPQKPLSLGDVPDGRVIEYMDMMYWKSECRWFRVYRNGAIHSNEYPAVPFTITNYIAEFK